ncbi:MAG: hypothetical protein IPP72_18420 [Chitinophagaceae bacterium]|nr:hypothetical protein [Chitinophagaceae bacterium]
MIRYSCWLLLFLLLQGCFGSNEKKDIITGTISKEKLRDDIALLKNMVQQVHAGAYAYNTPAQISFLFDSIYNTIEDPLTTREFFNKVDCAIDRLRCIHSSTTLPDIYYDSISNKAMFFPVPLLVINDRLYVNSAAYSLQLGSEVVAVNEHPARNLIKELCIYAHTDGYSDTAKHGAIDDDFGLNYYMAYGAFDKFTLQYTDTGSGQIRTRIVDAEKLKDINKNMYNDTWYFYPGDASYDFEMMDDKNAAVLTIRTFGYETYATRTAFNHFIENSFRLVYQNNISNLIIDLRNNSGGYYSSTYPVLNYLVNTTLPEYDSATRRFDKLPFTAYIAATDTSKLSNEDSIRKNFTLIRDGIYAENNEAITVWEPAQHLFKGRLFVIVNEHVASAASNFAAILKERTNAIIIGEETGGNNAAHNAMVFTYELPNSHLRVDIPTKRYYQPVQQMHTGRGVIPHKYMPFTVQDVIDNTDRPMNYILDSLLTNKVKL